MDEKSSLRRFVHKRLQMSICRRTPKIRIFRFLERYFGMITGNADPAHAGIATASTTIALNSSLPGLAAPNVDKPERHSSCG
jgi:hypothetical protein